MTSFTFLYANTTVISARILGKIPQHGTLCTGNTAFHKKTFLLYLKGSKHFL